LAGVDPSKWGQVNQQTWDKTDKFAISLEACKKIAYSKLGVESLSNEETEIFDTLLKISAQAAEGFQDTGPRSGFFYTDNPYQPIIAATAIVYQKGYKWAE
jgi:hypothetical protein